MKRYRYRKITPDILKKMKELRKQGLTYKEIGNKIGVTMSTALYHLSPREREMHTKRTMKYYMKLTKEQKRERERKSYDYKKKYYLERYHEDEEFRKRQIALITKSFNKRREGWERENLCLSCGGDKIEKKWKMCEKCRRKRREKIIFNINKRR